MTVGVRPDESLYDGSVWDRYIAKIALGRQGFETCAAARGLSFDLRAGAMQQSEDEYWKG